jgi:hypothetical protein
MYGFIVVFEITVLNFNYEYFCHILKYLITYLTCINIYGEKERISMYQKAKKSKRRDEGLRHERNNDTVNFNGLCPLVCLLYVKIRSCIALHLCMSLTLLLDFLMSW